jgi:hypothetical protein
MVYLLIADRRLQIAGPGHDTLLCDETSEVCGLPRRLLGLKGVLAWPKGVLATLKGKKAIPQK